MFFEIPGLLRKLPTAVLALSAIVLPAAALAQPVPSYAVHEDRIQGTVSRFDGQYTMYINDDRGFTDRVSLHQGTVINPTGIRLDNGIRVTVIGYPSGGTFVANEIDTPYHRWYGGYPYYGPAYYGPAIGVGFGWGYPYYRHWR